MNKNLCDYPHISDIEWYKLITSDELSYRKQLIKLKQDKQEEHAQEMIVYKASEATRIINTLRTEDVCKKHGLSEELTRHFSDGCYSPDEVQTRIDAARYFARTYPHLNLDEEQFMLLPVEEIKKRVNSMAKASPKYR